MASISALKVSDWSSGRSSMAHSAAFRGSTSTRLRLDPARDAERRVELQVQRLEEIQPPQAGSPHGLAAHVPGFLADTLGLDALPRVEAQGRQPSAGLR